MCRKIACCVVIAVELCITLIQLYHLVHNSINHMMHTMHLKPLSVACMPNAIDYVYTHVLTLYTCIVN
jgi:hypothetical protein